MGLTDDVLNEIQKANPKAYSMIRKEIDGRMWSKVGEYMKDLKKPVYFIREGKFFAVTDKVANKGTITKVAGAPVAVKRLNGLKVAGRVLTMIAVASDIYEIHNSGYEPQVITKKAGFWAGASLGAASMGSACAPLDFGGPWGWAVHGVLTICAGIGGGLSGEYIADETYKKVTTIGIQPRGGH